MNRNRHAARWAVLLLCLVVPRPAATHELVQWGPYGTEGSVRIKTKSKVLHRTSFLAQVADFSQLPSDARDGIFMVGTGTGLEPIGGDLSFMNPKGSKARLAVSSSALEPWMVRVGTLVRQSLEAKGDVVRNVGIEVRSVDATATFKTKPTPFFPLHKVRVQMEVKFRVVAELEGGRAKKGTVTLTVTSNGVRPGF